MGLVNSHPQLDTWSILLLALLLALSAGVCLVLEQAWRQAWVEDLLGCLHSHISGTSTKLDARHTSTHPCPFKMGAGSLVLQDPLGHKALQDLKDLLDRRDHRDLRFTPDPPNDSDYYSDDEDL